MIACPRFNDNINLPQKKKKKPNVSANNFGNFEQIICHFPGYYRVLYDENNWKALKRQLTEELTNNITETLLSPDERANLASDSLNLMLSGYMDSILAMDFIEFLKHERSMFVWKAALMALDGIRGFLKGDPEALVNFDVSSVLKIGGVN